MIFRIHKRQTDIEHPLDQRYLDQRTAMPEICLKHFISGGKKKLFLQRYQNVLSLRKIRNVLFKNVNISGYC